MTAEKSLFVTFEGGEGCGKSSQSRALYRRLHNLELPVLLVHEPGGTPLGKRITRLLKWDKRCTLSPLAELCLFNASRSELVASVIRPHLENGFIVICDRYTDSTIAYQSYGRRLPRDIVQQVNNAATGGLEPDITILLDLDVTEGLARKKKAVPDRFEVEALVFHKRVRQGFLELARQDSKRWLVIDAALSPLTIRQMIWRRLTPWLPPAKADHSSPA